MSQINEIIRTRRIALKMSQQKLANEVGITQPFMAEIESGRKTPSLEVLQKICKIINIDLVTELPNDQIDDEIYELRDMLRKRPEMKMLFSVTKNATKEEIEQTVALIETFKKQSE